MPAEKASYSNTETIMPACPGNQSREGLQVRLIYEQELNSGLRVHLSYATVQMKKQGLWSWLLKHSQGRSDTGRTL